MLYCYSLSSSSLLRLPRTAHLFSEEQRRDNQTVNDQEPIQDVAGDRRS